MLQRRASPGQRIRHHRNHGGIPARHPARRTSALAARRDRASADSAAAITAHFDQVFLSKIPAAQLNAALAHVTSLRLDAVLTSTSEFVTLAVTDNGQPQTVSVGVDARGLINGLGWSRARRS